MKLLESEYVEIDARIKEALQPAKANYFTVKIEQSDGYTVDLGDFCVRCRVLLTACSCLRKPAPIGP